MKKEELFGRLYYFALDKALKTMKELDEIVLPNKEQFDVYIREELSKNQFLESAILSGVDDDAIDDIIEEVKGTIRDFLEPNNVLNNQINLQKNSLIIGCAYYSARESAKMLYLNGASEFEQYDNIHHVVYGVNYAELFKEDKKFISLSRLARKYGGSDLICEFISERGARRGVMKAKADQRSLEDRKTIADAITEELVETDRLDDKEIDKIVKEAEKILTKCKQLSIKKYQ